MKRQSTILSVFTTTFAFILLIGLAGCRSSKSIVDQSMLDYSSLTLSERLQEVAAANCPWTQLNLPLKVSLKSPDKLSLSGRIYMRRNHDIYVTLRVLGIEVANMYVNKDSIYVADKAHKYYLAEPIDKIFAGASLSIGDIQDVLLGRAFINNRGTLTADMLNQVAVADGENNSWDISPQSKINGSISYSFRLSDSDNSMQSFTVDTGSKQYSCSYSDPTTIDGSRFMQRMSISTKVGKTEIDATLAMDFDKVKWEVPESARWRTPKNYRRINPRALSQAFKN